MYWLTLLKNPEADGAGNSTVKCYLIWGDKLGPKFFSALSSALSWLMGSQMLFLEWLVISR